MPATPTAEEIMGAISESGYLMEQNVATEFERSGFHVRTNVAFEDPDEGKSREIDVTAIKRVAYNEAAKHSAYVELIVECKNSSNPYLFIARPKNIADGVKGPSEFMFPYSYNMRRDLGGGRGLSKDVYAFHHLGFDKVYEEQSWKAVQFCRIDRKGSGWHANHGGLYDSMFYPMAKAVVSRKKEYHRPQSKDDWRYIWLHLPIVVTSSELFLIDSTASTPSPSPVDYVTFRRELKSGKLSGMFSLTFVRENALKSYLQNVVDRLAKHAADLVMNRSAFIEKTNVPWVD